MAPIDFLNRLKHFYAKDKEPLPLLSTKTVALLSVAFTALYVLPFYLSPTTRPSPTIFRDSPAVIQARIRFVTVACGFCALTTIYILSAQVHASRAEIFRLLGWYPLGVAETVRPVLLTVILFLGPLFEKGIVESGWRRWITGRPLMETLNDWIGWRNYVAGPISEEVLFRSLITPLSLLTPLTPTQTILLTPLYFGIAHVHHLYEFRLTHPGVPFLPALAQTLFQFAYTTLFGWYANFIFVRTGSLPAVILAHAFCNWMGLPRVWGRLEGTRLIGPVGEVDVDGGLGVGAGTGVSADRRAKSRETDREGGREERAQSKRRQQAGRATSQGEVGGSLAWGWTVGYYVLLVGGALGFWLEFWRLTESPKRLAVVWKGGA